MHCLLDPSRSFYLVSVYCPARNLVREHTEVHQPVNIDVSCDVVNEYDKENGLSTTPCGTSCVKVLLEEWPKESHRHHGDTPNAYLKAGISRVWESGGGTSRPWRTIRGQSARVEVVQRLLQCEEVSALAVSCTKSTMTMFNLWANSVVHEWL